MATTGWQGSRFKKRRQSYEKSELREYVPTAALTGATVQTVKNWETRPNGPEALYLKRLLRGYAEYFGVTTDDLFDELLPD